MPVCLHACSKQKTVISKQANLKYLDASAACSSITGASHCTLNLPEERMPFLWALIHPATLQQDSHCACKLLLHQVRMLAGVPASSMNVLGANRNGHIGAHMWHNSIDDRSAAEARALVVLTSSISKVCAAHEICTA